MHIGVEKRPGEAWNQKYGPLGNGTYRRTRTIDITQLSWIDLPLLDEATDDTKSVVDGTVSLIQDQLVGAADKNAHSLSLLGDTANLSTTDG